MKDLSISDDHMQALVVINDSYYQEEDLGKTVERMIEEHLTRERGRLGVIKGEKYLDE